MSIFHIILQVEVDNDTDPQSEALNTALHDLAAVMAVQGEDGLFIGGNPDADDAEFVSDATVEVAAVVQIEDADDVFDLTSPGSIQGYIETGRHSTVREQREINAPGGFDPDQSYCLLDDTGDYWAYNHPHGVWVPVLILGGHFSIDNQKAGLFFTEHATAGFPSDQIDATGRAR